MVDAVVKGGASAVAMAKALHYKQLSVANARAAPRRGARSLARGGLSGESTEVVVVDYDIGNVFSVCHAIKHAGGEPVLTGDHLKIARAERLVLPGGLLGSAVEELRRAI